MHPDFTSFSSCEGLATVRVFQILQVCLYNKCFCIFQKNVVNIFYTDLGELKSRWVTAPQ